TYDKIQAGDEALRAAWGLLPTMSRQAFKDAFDPKARERSGHRPLASPDEARRAHGALGEATKSWARALAEAASLASPSAYEYPPLPVPVTKDNPDEILEPHPAGFWMR